MSDTITRHHVQGAAWTLWTGVSALGAWMLFIAPHPLPPWSIVPCVISGFTAVIWAIFHLIVVAFWLSTRPNPKVSDV